MVILDYFMVCTAGEPGLAGAGDRQPQHGGPDAAHVRRGAAADLHAHAPRLLPAVRQLAHLQGPPQDVRRHRLRVTHDSRHGS